ncbi:MAG: aminotransferase class V-fold PLP-dependent enzyme [Verrucomicrobia bacterium]|nr:aminotransferase class V-fold PLP-dependent enzyme [Verrucomicrobiota bacterium]
MTAFTTETQKLANTSNITFGGIESESLLLLLDQEGICTSSGSACLADSDEPLHMVKAMKSDKAASRQMIHFLFDENNETDQIRNALASAAKAARMLRA